MRQAQTHRQRGEKPRSKTSRGELPRVPDRSAQSALDGEEQEEVQSEGEADHETDAGTLAEVSDSRTTELPPRLSELLRARDRVWRGTRTGQVDTHAHQAVLLETVGQAEDAQAQAAEAGDRSR